MIENHPLAQEIDNFTGRGIISFLCHYSSDDYDDRLYKENDIQPPKNWERWTLKRKAEYFAGRYCAKNVLTRLGCDSAVLIGKSREPIWPKGITGSISHSDDSAICIATTEPWVLGLGVDVEKMVSEDEYRSLLHFVVKHDEKKPEVRLDPTIFTTVFSAKESFYKAVYPSINKFLDFSAIRLEAIENDRLNFSVRESLDSLYPTGFRIQVKYLWLDDEQVLSLCIL